MAAQGFAPLVTALATGMVSLVQMLVNAEMIAITPISHGDLVTLNRATVIQKNLMYIQMSYPCVLITCILQHYCMLTEHNYSNNVHEHFQLCDLLILLIRREIHATLAVKKIECKLEVSKVY